MDELWSALWRPFSAELTYAYPWVLWFLVVPPVLAAVLIWRMNRRHERVSWSALDQLASYGGNWREKLRFLPPVLRALALGALIVVLARPRSSKSWNDVTTEGIDIVIALDISGSMLARDFRPDRLEASKEVAMEFIEARPNDRMGLVVYSAESFTQCPLTTDHRVLKNLFTGIRNGMIADGTAIGLGLANAVTRLKESKAKSKVVILLTDGSNTTGDVPPLTAAEIAQTFGVRVYTIGVGTNGMAPYPFKDPFGNRVYQDVEVKIDEETLTQIADMTGGAYFRATDKATLKAIYERIDELEKSIIEEVSYQQDTEEFLPFAVLAILLLAIEFILRNTLLRSIT